MNKLICSIILFTSIIFAILSIDKAEAQHITANEIDAFTNTIRIDASLLDEGARFRSRDFIDQGNLIYPSVAFIKTEDGNETFVLYMMVRNLRGCLSQHRSRIMLLLEDSQTLTLGQISRTDCTRDSKVGSFILGSEIPYDTINDDNRFDENTATDNGYYIPRLLTEKSIDQIRIYGSEGYQDYEIKEEKKEAIKNMLKLLLNEIPSN